MKKNWFKVIAIVLLVFVAAFTVRTVTTIKANDSADVIFEDEQIVPLGRDEQSREPEEEYAPVSTVTVVKMEEEPVAVAAEKKSSSAAVAETVEYIDEEITPLGRDEQSREPQVEEEISVQTMDEEIEEVMMEEEMEVIFIDEEIEPLGRDVDSREPVEE